MSYGDQPIRDFLDGVASSEVTPAGGTAAAIVGAIGTALSEMVCLHTIGKDGYGDVEAELAEIREDLGTRRAFLLDLADRDAEAVDDLFAASRGDADRPVALKQATGVPLTIAQACLPVLEQTTVVAEKGTRNAVPDAGTGSFLVHSALQASVFTVRTNVASLPDAAVAERMERRAAGIERSAEVEFERVLSRIEARR